MSAEDRKARDRRDAERDDSEHMTIEDFMKAFDIMNDMLQRRRLMELYPNGLDGEDGGRKK